MQFSERMAHIKPSATLTINAKALELKSQGVDVTSLAIGEPNFPTPAHVCDAAKQAIDEGFTRYTAVPGIPPLREAIAGYFKRAYGVDVAPDCTIASNGGKQSLYNLFAALLNDGDEVLIPSPYWVSYPDMVYLNGGVPVAVKAPASQGFKVTVEQLEAALTPKAKILVFNSPSNPTGACYSVSERDAIVKWALDRGLFIIADEIYDQLVYEPNKPSSIIVWWKQYPDRIAVVNGLAKSFAMTGWRVGYTVTHPDLVKKLSQITGQATGNICSVSQKAAVAALTGPYDCVESMRQAFQKRRDMAWKEIASWSNVVCPKPEGAFYLFADISALYDEKMPDATAACTRLLSEAGVALVPGDAFGAPDCIRFSYAVADDVLMDALARGRMVHIGQYGGPPVRGLPATGKRRPRTALFRRRYAYSGLEARMDRTVADDGPDTPAGAQAP